MDQNCLASLKPPPSDQGAIADRRSCCKPSGISEVPVFGYMMERGSFDGDLLGVGTEPAAKYSISW